MLKRIALLAPIALIVAAAACGGESSSPEDEQSAGQANGAGEAPTGTGDGVAEEDLAGPGSGHHPGNVGPGGGGIKPPIGSAPPDGGGGITPPIGTDPPGGGVGIRPPIGNVRPGGGWGRGPGFRRGWVNGRWAPGWGWNRGVWVVGGGVQYSCATDVDCAATLGPGVAVCDFEPTVGLGQCVAPNWY